MIYRDTAVYQITIIYTLTRSNSSVFRLLVLAGGRLAVVTGDYESAWRMLHQGSPKSMQQMDPA